MLVLSRYKKFILIIFVILSLCLMVAASYLYFLNKKGANETPEATLDSTLAEISTGGIPDESFTSKLSAYLEQADDPAEKFEGYYILANSHYLVANHKEALEAYRQAKQLESHGDLSDEEKSLISERILMLEEQVNISSGEPKELDGGFKEPDE